jgi:hypothetical protein
MLVTRTFRSLFSALHPQPIQTALLTAAPHGKLLMIAVIQQSARSAYTLIRALRCSAAIHKVSGATPADMIAMATASRSLSMTCYQQHW